MNRRTHLDVVYEKYYESITSSAVRLGEYCDFIPMVQRATGSKKGRLAPIYSSVRLADRLIRTVSASSSTSSRRTAAVDLVHFLVTLCSGLTNRGRTNCVICIQKNIASAFIHDHHHPLNSLQQSNTCMMY